MVSGSGHSIPHQWQPKGAQPLSSTVAVLGQTGIGSKGHSLSVSRALII